MSQLETTVAAEILINSGKFNKVTLSQELGITRPTLDSRLSGSSVWKKLEVKWINHLKNDRDKI